MTESCIPGIRDEFGPSEIPNDNPLQFAGLVFKGKLWKPQI
jgi:hypothetical protein